MEAIWIGAGQRNFTPGRRGGHRPEAIVIHVMDGSLLGTDAWFNDPANDTAAHYGVGRAGAVHQYVRETDTAHHAGIVDRPSWPGLKPGVNPNFYTIGIEHEGQGASGGAWPEAQLAASVALVRTVADRWAIPVDAGHIVPHRAIRAGKSDCPGVGLDLTAYIARVAAFVPGAAGANVPPAETAFAGRVAATIGVRVRARATSASMPLGMLRAGDPVDPVAYVVGEAVRQNPFWYRRRDGRFVWAGGTSVADPSRP